MENSSDGQEAPREPLRGAHRALQTSFLLACHLVLQNFPLQKPSQPPQLLTDAVSIFALFNLECFHHRHPHMPAAGLTQCSQSQDEHPAAGVQVSSPLPQPLHKGLQTPASMPRPGTKPTLLRGLSIQAGQKLSSTNPCPFALAKESVVKIHNEEPLPCSQSAWHCHCGAV